MFRLLQIELFKIFKRPRTYISFAVIAVIIFLVAAWSLERKPKVKKKVFSSEVNRLLELDEMEESISN